MCTQVGLSLEYDNARAEPGNLYFKPSEPFSCGGVQPLIKCSKFDKNVVKNLLLSQNVYSLHKSARRLFKGIKHILLGFMINGKLILWICHPVQNTITSTTS